MTRSSKDARELPIQQADELELPPTGDLGGVRAQTKDAEVFATKEIESPGAMADAMDKIKLLAFYEEKLEVTLLESADINPEPYVFLSVNGRGPMPGPMSQWCPRNVPIMMARKYVEVLARAKPVHIRTVDAVDTDGYKTKVVRSTSSLRYPFAVSRDPNPRGAAWLREVMRQR